MSKTRTPAERTSAPPSGLPVREATAGCELPDYGEGFRFPGPSMDGPKENTLVLDANGQFVWTEPSEGFPMGYRVTPEQRTAGYIPTREELMAGYTTCYERDPETGKLVVVLDCECRR